MEYLFRYRGDTCNGEKYALDVLRQITTSKECERYRQQSEQDDKGICFPQRRDPVNNTRQDQSERAQILSRRREETSPRRENRRLPNEGRKDSHEEERNQRPRNQIYPDRIEIHRLVRIRRSDAGGRDVHDAPGEPEGAVGCECCRKDQVSTSSKLEHLLETRARRRHRVWRKEN